MDKGRCIDPAGCRAIKKSDLKTHELHFDVKHGRYWAAHVWFEPGTLRPAFAKTDPWCRQSSQALDVPPNAFRWRGSCPSSCAPATQFDWKDKLHHWNTDMKPPLTE